MANVKGQGSLRFDTTGSITGNFVINGIWADGKAAGKTVTLTDDADVTIFHFTSTAEQTSAGLGGLCLKVSKVIVTTLTDAAEVIVYHE